MTQYADNPWALTVLVASWAIMTGGIWKLFDRAEKVTSTEAKKDLTLWLKNLNPERQISKWATTFETAFDAVFGERHLTWRCFGRSCIASMISTTIVVLLAGAYSRHVYWGSEFEGRTLFELILDEPQTLFGFLFGTAILNFGPDYLSLLESRYLIRLMGKHRRPLRTASLLILDILATIGIFAVPAVALFTLMEGSLSEAIRVLTKAAAFEDLLSVWFYTTFFTSIWLWLYVTAGFIIKLGKPVGSAADRLKWLLDVDNKPFLSVGVIIILLVTVLYVALAPLSVVTGAL